VLRRVPLGHHACNSPTMCLPSSTLRCPPKQLHTHPSEPPPPVTASYSIPPSSAFALAYSHPRRQPHSHQFVNMQQSPSQRRAAALATTATLAATTALRCRAPLAFEVFQQRLPLRSPRRRRRRRALTLRPHEIAAVRQRNGRCHAHRPPSRRPSRRRCRCRCATGALCVFGGARDGGDRGGH
jgi:hypothetical protein